MKHCLTCHREVNDQVRFCPFCGSPTANVESDPSMGFDFAGEYRIERKIREGDPSTLYVATQLATGAKVVLAVLPRRLIEKIGADRLALSLEAASRVSHPCLATVLEARIVNVEAPFLVLEYFDGVSLSEKLKQGRLEIKEAVQIIRDVASALEAVHINGLSFGALTPESVWLTGSGADASAKVTDLVIARVLAGVDSRLLGEGANHTAGRRYLTPEQLTGEGGAPSDIYSLGLIAYEMMAGESPFQGLNPFEVVRTNARPKPLPASLPNAQSLDLVFQRALKVKPEERQQSVAILAKEIQDAVTPSITCWSCGFEIAPDDVFCENCGALPKALAPNFSPPSKEFSKASVQAIYSEPPLADQTSAANPASSTNPIYYDDNVQFTVYRPRTIRPMTWSTLLAFAHLSEKRRDAPPDAPDPLAEVQKQAHQALGEQIAQFQKTSQDSMQAVPREGEITFIPVVPGIEFNPPGRTFLWEEDVHKEEFRLRASSGLDHQTARGRLSVFLGSILVAEVTLSIRIDSTTTADPTLESTAAQVYRKIFASYSHKDAAIVEQFEHYAQAFGDEYLRDVNHLRAGQVWSDRLEKMIIEADIFQLFWSTNSMNSEFVKREWEFALSRRQPNFIRPTYWEEPLPSAPEKDLPPEALSRLHFQLLSVAGVAPPAHPRTEPSFGSPPIGAESIAASKAPGGAEASPPAPLMERVYCGHCAEKVGSDDVFCAHCGTRQPTPGSAAAAYVGAGPPDRITAELVDVGTPTGSLGEEVAVEQRFDEHQRSAQRIRSRRKFLSARRLVPLAAIVLVSTLSIAVLFSYQSGSPAPPRSANSDSGSARPTDLDYRPVTITTLEPRARVYRGDQLVGTTPFVLPVRNGDHIRLTLKADGYADKDIDFTVAAGKEEYTFMMGRTK